MLFLFFHIHLDGLLCLFYGKSVTHYRKEVEKVATIRDVAKLAGVSVATVSRVLNKKGYVHEETVKQVEEAIERLQYKPNAVAKSLFKKSSTMIALLVSDDSAPSFFELFSSIEQAAYEAGYQIVIGRVNGKASYVDTLLQNNVAGFLVMNEVYEQVKKKISSTPFVVLDGELHNTYAAVRCCDYEGAKLATEQLIKKGCRFLAHLRGPEHHEAMHERLEGFIDTAEYYNIPYRVVTSGLSVREGEQATIAMLQHAPYIDGIVACNDIVGIGALRAAHRLHLSVPDQLQLIGIDGIAAGEFLYPALTTVGQPYGDKGTIAVHMLLRQMKEQTEAVRRLRPVLIERETTR